MRRVLLAAIGLIGLGVFGTPAAAAACETDSCQRWLGLEPVLSTFPRDAAIVLEGSRHPEVCAEGLPAHVQVVVRSGDTVVPGDFEAPVGLLRALVWRPDDALDPGEYAMTVKVDNAALEALAGVPAQSDCGPDVYEETIAFTVGSETSERPSLVPPPVFKIQTRPLAGDWRSLACCPGIVPFEGFSSDCRPTIGSSGGGDCIYFHDFNYLEISTVQAPLAPGGVYLYQLVVDGELVGRGLNGASIWRNHRACAHVEAIHLGTGEVFGSEVVCPPDELEIGPTEHVPDSPLACEQALACGTDDGWDPNKCEPYVVGEPPGPPTAPMADAMLETMCEAPTPATMPEYPSPPGQGCGCTQATGTGPLLLVVGLLLRRRRPPRPPHHRL